MLLQTIELLLKFFVEQFMAASSKSNGIRSGNDVGVTLSIEWIVFSPFC